MTATLEVDLVLETLVKELGSGLYFTLITSENGAIIKSYINQEFNKNSIGLNMSQLYEIAEEITYEIAEEITSEIGVHSPDFTVIHSDNFYVLSLKILNRIVIILMEDQIDFSSIFEIVNKCIITN